MSRTQYQQHQNCSVCGRRIEREVFEAQRDRGGFTAGADCRDCLEGVRDSPQYQNLLEEIRENLSDDNREEWDASDTDARFWFALHLINEGIANGGSPGFHEQLRKYVCLLSLDEKEANGGDA